ncbi:MAG TPA: aldose epimerase [Cellulomonas sp.]
MAVDELRRTAPAIAPVVTLRTDRWEVDVLPGTGAALAGGRIRTADGEWRDLLRPTPRHRRADPEHASSFPMLPWSNRIDAGVLPFGGRTWQLQRNGADGTAIHGALRYAPWAVAALADEAVVLEADTVDLVGVNFPWRFAARVGYTLRGGTLEVSTTVRNTDDEPFPAGFGHHPYFRRALRAVGSPPPDEPGEPLLHVAADAGYALHGGLATGVAGAVPRRADYRSARPVGTAHVDDVLTGRLPGPLATLRYADPSVTVTIEADEAYSHVVLYAPRGRGYLAVEPATHVNGGFALHAAGVPGTGVVVLEPGAELTAAFRITVEA